MTWHVFATDDGTRHVIPVSDLRPHDHTGACWCRPKPDTEDPDVIVHNSLDRREMVERGEVPSQ
jgi:hypothetical protein